MSMSTLAVVYIGTDSAYPFEPFFGGRSAFERCLDWLHSLSCVSRVLVCTDSGAAAPERAAYIAEAAERAACEASEKTYERRTLETPCTAALLAAAARAAKDCGAERVLFALGNCPFYDAALTQELLETHSRYAAEYTFADCYPLGFAPEVLDTGALGILARFAQGGEGIPQAAADAGRKSISFDSIFGVIKTDVNSFEIETVLSPLDMRLYRLEFSCASKRTALSCRALYEAAEKRHDFSPLALCRAARETPAVLRTVPSSMDSREVECFVFDKAGVWFYNDETNALELVSEGDKRMATTAGQDFVGVAPVTLVFAVNQKKLEKIDPGHAGEIMKSADVGAMMQNALLACSAMGLAAVPRVWFDPQAVLDAMGKTMAEYEPQMAVTVGFAA